MASWRDIITQTIYQEYDRRIRRASLVVEYGASHHAAHTHAPDEDEGDVEIANVPRGAEALELPALPAADAAPPTPSPAGSSGEAEIVNAPPGTPVK